MINCFIAFPDKIRFIQCQHNIENGIIMINVN